MTRPLAWAGYNGTYSRNMDPELLLTLEPNPTILKTKIYIMIKQVFSFPITGQIFVTMHIVTQTWRARTLSLAGINEL